MRWIKLAIKRHKSRMHEIRPSGLDVVEIVDLPLTHM